MTEPLASQGASARDGMVAVQVVAMIVGSAFVTLGLLGFIPGVTTGYAGMAFAGHESTAMLLGIFQVSVLHNLVHIAFGVAGLLVARTMTASVAYLIAGGLVYLALWLYGMLIAFDTPANFVPINMAGNRLHLGLGLGMVVLGTALFPRPRNRTVRGTDDPPSA